MKEKEEKKLKRKVSPTLTLLSMQVGTEMLIREEDCRYNTLYTIAKRLEKQGHMFEVSVKGVVGTTRVRRLR